MDRDPMPFLTSPASVTALIYLDGFAIDTLMRRIAGYLASEGVALAGFLQLDLPRDGQSRCDMVLEELASGERIQISESRGEHARGCRLDTRELARAEALAINAVERRPDLLLINKFGKTEAHGGGFRALLACALERDVPVLIAVPARNIEAWRVFAADFSADWLVAELHEETAALCAKIGLDPVRRAAATAQKLLNPARSS